MTRRLGESHEALAVWVLWRGEPQPSGPGILDCPRAQAFLKTGPPALTPALPRYSMWVNVNGSPVGSG
jgi:hypothetical protein